MKNEKIKSDYGGTEFDNEPDRSILVRRKANEEKPQVNNSKWI